LTSPSLLPFRTYLEARWQQATRGERKLGSSGKELARDAVVHKSLRGRCELLDGHDEYRAERRLSDRRSTRHSQ